MRNKHLINAAIVSGILFWLLLLVAAFGKAFSQDAKYRLGKEKIIGFSVVVIGGFADGVVEGYEFDGRTSFERKWGADPEGFWGSQSWRLAYKNGDPDQGYKNLFTQVYGSPDFYHLADDVRKYSYITGSISVGIGAGRNNTRWWHYALDFGISFAVSGLTKRAGMTWVRN